MGVNRFETKHIIKVRDGDVPKQEGLPFGGDLHSHCCLFTTSSENFFAVVNSEWDSPVSHGQVCGICTYVIVILRSYNWILAIMRYDINWSHIHKWRTPLFNVYCATRTQTALGEARKQGSDSLKLFKIQIHAAPPRRCCNDLNKPLRNTLRAFQSGHQRRHFIGNLRP